MSSHTIICIQCHICISSTYIQSVCRAFTQHSNHATTPTVTITISCMALRSGVIANPDLSRATLCLLMRTLSSYTSLGAIYKVYNLYYEAPLTTRCLAFLRRFEDMPLYMSTIGMVEYASLSSTSSCICLSTSAFTILRQLGPRFGSV